MFPFWCDHLLTSFVQAMPVLFGLWTWFHFGQPQ